jgi:hypothetical protein
MKKVILQTFDIESSGPVVGKHSLLAVGITAYEFYFKGDKPILNLLDTIEVHVFNDPIVYDEQTRQFWKENSESFNIINTNLIEKEIAAERLIDFIKNYQRLAIDNSYDYKIVTDNCWYDDTFLSWFLCVYGLDGLPLRYNYYTGYMKINQVIDLSQRINSLKIDANIELDISVPNQTPHDHTPVNDAKGLAEQYVKYIIATKQLKNHKKK